MNMGRRWRPPAHAQPATKKIQIIFKLGGRGKFIEATQIIVRRFYGELIDGRP
jgi:hypothetical protein